MGGTSPVAALYISAMRYLLPTLGLFFALNPLQGQGLTTEQINSALIDKNTLLPNYLKIEWKSETEFKCHVSQQKRT